MDYNTYLNNTDGMVNQNKDLHPSDKDYECTSNNLNKTGHNNLIRNKACEIFLFWNCNNNHYNHHYNHYNCHNSNC